MTAMASGLLVGQVMKWVPIWLTPIWVLSVGVLLGALAAVAVFGLLALLSFLPPVGRFADSPRRAITLSLILGGVIGGGLCWLYVPEAGNYSGSLILPLMTIGLVVGFGLIYGTWERTRAEWFPVMSEGVVPYLLSTVGAFTLLGLAATPLVDEPRQILESVRDVNLVGDGTVTLPVQIPGFRGEDPDDAPFVAAGIAYDLRSAAEVVIRSDRTVLLADAEQPSDFQRTPTRVDAGDEMAYRYEDREIPPIPSDASALHIQNREIDPATVVFEFKNRPLVPEAASIVWTAIAIFITVSGFVALRQAAPRVWALALSTSKNEMGQPLYLLLLGLGLFGVLLFAVYPFNTMGDDIRLLKDSGVTLIMVLAMLQAVWSAGTSVSDEIEGRTALTVLSKPVSRRAFVLGKYAGIMLSVSVLFAILAAVLLVMIAYKPIYDSRENSQEMPVWQVGHEELMTTIPVLGLYFMQTMVIAAIAVALATRLPLIANFIICFVIYVIGNLTSPLVASAQGNNELVSFVGKLIAVVVPNLNTFNVQAAVDAGNPIPIIYLAGAFNYLVCFAIAIWMLAMLLFEDRDLA